VILSKNSLRLGPSAYLSRNLRINWIISRIPCRISKIIFVQGSYESLAMLNSKTRQAVFSMIQYCKIAVCRLPKGQLFLKCSFGVFKSAKKSMIFIGFLVDLKKPKGHFEIMY
jgi:hypothetical protein